MLLKQQTGSRRWPHLAGGGAAANGAAAANGRGPSPVEQNYTVILGSHRNSCLKFEKDGELCCMVSTLHSGGHPPPRMEPQCCLWPATTGHSACLSIGKMSGNARAAQAPDHTGIALKAGSNQPPAGSQPLPCAWLPRRWPTRPARGLAAARSPGTGSTMTRGASAWGGAPRARASAPPGPTQSQLATSASQARPAIGFNPVAIAPAQGHTLP